MIADSSRLEYIVALAMSTHTFPHDELFHEPGPEEALNYLWGRLQDRDLSGEEALALLGAVHRQLGSERAGDPKVYFAYTRFMESLSREMPLVHDYVVARWIENRRSARRETRDSGDPEPGSMDEDGPAAVPASTPVAATQPVRSFSPVPVSAGGGAEGPEEAGESDADEKKDDPDEGSSLRERDTDADPTGDDEADTYPDEAGDAQQLEATEADEDTADELSEQEEASEAEEREAEPAEADPDPETQEASVEEDQADDGPADSADASEPADEGAGETAETEGGEWPAEEEPEPPEPTEEMEGEGDEPSPEA